MSDTSDDEVLAAAEAIAEKATPGPWDTVEDRVPGHPPFVIVDSERSTIYATEQRCEDSDYDHAQAILDGRFIAASREGWPEAVAIARRLQGELRVTDAAMKHNCAVAVRLEAENAALTERLRVAEGRIARVEALQAKAPYGLFTYGTSGDYEQGIADYAKLLRAALAPTSDAAPKATSS